MTACFCAHELRAGPMHALIERLLAERPVVTDGAWATEFLKQGLQPGGSADAWNLEHAERVESLAKAYVAAGSRVILTNTFQANRIALARHGLGGRVREINRAGVEISRRAAREHAYVFASIGPTGSLIATGDTSEAELREVFTEQVESLAEAGPDALVIETMSDPGEAKCALWAAHASGLPVVACMAFDSGKDKTRTMMGTTPQEAAAILTAAGADVIGANCGQGIEGYVELYKGLAAATGCPIWLKPNAGSPELVGTETVYRTTPEAFAGSASALVNAGVAFIGGCCGTTPAFIAALSRALHPETQAMPCA
jgi:5-methyltetrahydrofolate--homocysteine methyltransferase